jgi:DegV family protein with EDD domain
MVKSGYSFEEIVEQTKWNAQHIDYGFTVDDMNWLAKGGRLPKAIGVVGSALKVKPYLTLNEKGIEKKGLVRGQDRVYSRMVKDIKEGTKNFKEQLIAISHVGHEENAKMIQEKIKEAVPEAKTQIFEIGAVLAAHLGIGAIGVFYLTEKPERYMEIS